MNNRDRKGQGSSIAARHRRTSPDIGARHIRRTRSADPEPTQTNAKVEAMVRKIMADSRGYTNEDWGVDRSHTPFTDDIPDFQYPRRFNLPPIDQYGGRTDPRQHLKRYS